MGDVRIIHDDAIDRVFYDDQKQLLEDELSGGNGIPSYVVIDWEATIENLKVDSYGHYFNSYNGEEYHGGDHYVFRTN